MVRFLLNGLEEVCAAPPPDQTVLQWLRVQRRLTGSKEGCAEGDCGACTVVLAEPEGDGLRWRPANACILMMGQLHGRLLVTVEGLADGESLHPVQAAMVAHHASQCGFCTPGFVMSLFAAFRSGESARTSEIHDCVAGNLCRCTGYRPIVDAAADALSGSRDDRFSPLATDIATRLREIAAGPALSVETDAGRFLAPRSRSQLAAALAADPGARLIAGGTDLGLDVTKRRQPQRSLVSVNAVAELKTMEEQDGALVIGAAVPYADALPRLAAIDPSIGVLLRRLGSRQIRALGTIGGNIANASPIGDTPPLLLALGASVTIGSATGEREVSLDAFFTGYRRTVLRPGEFIDRISIPLPRPGDLVQVDKISRRFDQDISAVCGALFLRREGDRIALARVAFGGMAATPARATAVEAALTGAPVSRQTFENAAQALARDFKPIDDFRASAAYRLRAAENLFERWFLAATGALEAAE